MTLEEFGKIIESYGSSSERWPVDMREECENFIADNSEARELVNRQLELEMLMDQIAVPEFPGLEARVLDQQLPSRKLAPLDQFLEWLLPADKSGKQFWRPAMVACLPLIFGIIIGNFYNFGVGLQGESFEYWDDELYILSLNDYTENLF
ncbi:MAG TPA: hypothetical protein DCS89_14135 [Gammaproteobacteria bacterium]|jgi:hypothetical protein|nr:hypothetical protein [Gammaproteobacteria bacterium]HAT28152.1 hypothetical protein [Gammaproteobacteria bacterium]HIN90402.1 hypothetical protein [Porticoccaceae bacterium]|tara:strand:- start:1659 stop:2108 length:450 start_codon:yes stop_codon:yes gene_type:complete